MDFQVRCNLISSRSLTDDSLGDGVSVCEPEEIQTSSSERPSSVSSGDCRQSGCGLHAECQYQPLTDLFSCQCIRGYKVVIREIHQSFSGIIILLRVMEVSVFKMRMI